MFEFFLSTFLDNVFYEIQFLCNFSPCIYVYVTFLVLHYSFVVKTKATLYCSINISSS